MRKALGIDDGVQTLTPAELMRAVLKAPVDLLWNGGIGTYVKAAGETDAEAGDKANDAIRVNGRDLRAQCVGEGGNLGLTQLGRIEYAERGGRINTDFIDNSAGVDTSDHEVNIKILLDRVVAAGDMTEKQRNALLAAMTDEVAGLVLRDNYEQNLALANAAANAPSLLHVHEDWMRQLEKRGVLNRELEGLPSTRQVRRMLEREEGLSVPELSVLLAWTKIVLADELLASDLPDDPYCHVDLTAYFPEPIQQGFADQVAEHPLRREIIVTQVVNDLVNGAGLTFWPRLQGETGAGPGRADPGQLRGPRDLRVAALPRRGRLPRQRARGRGADPDAHRDAHARRAGVAMADHQPAPTARQPGHGRVLPRPGAGGDA